MNPWLAVGVLILLAASHSLAYYKGGQREADAQKAAELIRRETFDAAQLGAAAAIAKIEVRNVTIRQVLEREIYEKPVYRDCKHTVTGLRVLNAALGGANPADLSELSRAAPAQK